MVDYSQNPLNPMLKIAALAGVSTAVQLHISRGDDLNARDAAGMTPLMLAASKDNILVVTILVEAGADPWLLDLKGNNALSLAHANNAQTIINAWPTIVRSMDTPDYTSEVEAIPEIELSSLDNIDLSGAWEWEAYEEPPEPETDDSVVKAAALIQQSISKHLPVDNSEEWLLFDVNLPDQAASYVDEDTSHHLKSILVKAIREGTTHEIVLKRLYQKFDDFDFRQDLVVRTLLAEIGVIPDEWYEDENDSLILEATAEEEYEIQTLIAYGKDLTPGKNDPLSLYSKDIRKGKLLKRDEEVFLGKEMEAGISVAINALASWEFGLSQLNFMSIDLAAGSVSLASITLGSLEEDIQVDLDNEDLDSESSHKSNHEKNHFLNKLEHVLSLLQKSLLGSKEMISAIQRLQLTPAFLFSLLNMSEKDSDAVAFEKGLERYSNAKQTMTLCNLRLVYKVVQRYQGRGVELEDLIQEGNIGLLKAVERYDWRKGFKFSTYAVWWIRQVASRAVIDCGRTIRVPVHQAEKIPSLSRAIDEFYNINGCDPSDSELSEISGLSIDKIKILKSCMEELLNIDEFSSDESYQHLCVDESKLPENIVEYKRLYNSLISALGDLDERSAIVVKLRYGLTGLDPLTLEEIGQLFGVTRERIRQLENKALKKLAHPSRSYKWISLLYSDSKRKTQDVVDDEFFRENES